MFEATIIKISLNSFLKPSIYISSSVFNLLLASCSFLPFLYVIIESISSIKIVLGQFVLASSNKIFTVFSESPWYLDTSELADILKKVV